MSAASLVVFLLVGIMFATSAVTSFSLGTINFTASTNSAIVASKDTDDDLVSKLDPDKAVEGVKSLKAEDKIGLIIEMDETTLIDIYLANPGKYATFSDYVISPEGKIAAENLINKQNALFNKIARQADVKLKYNYTSVMNGFAIEITYGDRELIDRVAYKSNVLNTFIGEHYAAPEATVVENKVVIDQETGIFDSSDSKEQGEGMVVGVLDTGIDWEHTAFDPHQSYFGLYDEDGNIIETREKELKMNKEYIAEVLPLLSGAQRSVSNLSASDVYKNEKIPYAFDYADYDTEVNSNYENMHGTHVAGIIAGHSDAPYKNAAGVIYFKDRDNKFYYRDDKGIRHDEANGVITFNDGDKEISINVSEDDICLERTGAKTGNPKVGIIGVAPKAQLAIFKVFSDYQGGAEHESLMAAVEDCAKIGVDVVNMSLGSDSGFQEDADTKDSIYRAYEKVGDCGLSLVCAASNAYSSGFNTHYGLNLTSNPDSATVGNPSTYDAAFSVASISGVKSKYLLGRDNQNNELGVAYFEESAHLNSESYDFISDLWDAIQAKLNDNSVSDAEKALLKSYIVEGDSAKNCKLKVPYVTIPGLGEDSNYMGKDVKNKIVLVSRGKTTFEEKLQVAVGRHALACVIFNNAAGIIRMQVGDELVNEQGLSFPSCSIKMDASVQFKNKDTSSRPAYFEISYSNEAGPFMSEFSSWGPLPNLLLKPDITAHGGDIYSAAPGDDTSYDRISGTSMASPNMAGVVTLMRQFMQKKENAEKYDVMKDDKTIDYNLMEQRVYQILMSTATIANNDEGNPYSPRKQGSGLADLTKAQKTEQYIYVTKNVTEDGVTKEVEKDRTKIELLDDPDREGKYDLDFYVKNVGTNDAKYKLSSLIFTEKVSSDGKTVAEQAYMLNDNKLSLKVGPKDNQQEVAINKVTVDGAEVQKSNEFTVEGGSEVKVTFTIELSEASIKYLEDNFKNGMYVEGYVCLDNTDDKDGVDLNVPFLKFYGDWEDAPIMDYDIYEVSADEDDDTIDEDDKRYAGGRALQLFAKVEQNGAEYVFGMGQNPFLIAEEFEDTVVEVTQDKCAMSFNSASSMSNLYCAGGFLRGAKKVFYTITNAITGEVIVEDIYYNARKAGGASGIGGAWLDIDLTALRDKYNNGVSSNGRYNITVYPVLDWHSEKYNTIEDIKEGWQERMYKKCTCSDKDKCIMEEACEDELCGCRGNKYYWSSDFWIDTDSPFISDTQVRIVRDRNGDAKYYLDLYATDNHYLSAISFDYYDAKEKDYTSFYAGDGGLRPIISDRNTTALVTFDITNLWDQISDGLLYLKTATQAEINQNPEKGTLLTQFQVLLYDYAFNKAFYTIDLAALIKNYDEIRIGDIGNYMTYSYNGNSIKVLTSYSKTVSENAPTLETLNLVQGQKFELARAIIGNPIDAWREDLIFETAAPQNVLRVDKETGEMYAVGEGKNLTVTVKSRSNKDTVPAKLTVNILSDAEASNYRIPVNSLKEKSSFTGVKMADNYNGLNLNAGEEYKVSIENIEPWFFDLDKNKYFIRWTSGTEIIATVEYDPHDSMHATIKANAGKWDDDGKYTTNLTGYSDITATLCEIVEKSTNPNNVIKDNIHGDIHFNPTSVHATFTVHVLKEFVVEGNVLTEYHGGNWDDNAKEIVIPSNLHITEISSFLFYERNDIKSIEFPEGLETISNAACAYMRNLEKVVLPSTIQSIGEYAFAAYTPTGSTDAPQTKLSIIDMRKCATTIEVKRNAFMMQRFLGVDLEKSNYEDTFGVYSLKYYDEVYFDTKMVRTADQFSFYGLDFVKDLDLTGLRAARLAAFYNFGKGVAGATTDDKVEVKVVLGENTVLHGGNAQAGTGGALFIESGITTLELPMRRIGSQTFFGSQNNQTALKKVVFTANDVIVEDAAFCYNTGLESVEFKGTVEYIGNSAFARNSALSSVTFDGAVNKIGPYAFEGTDLQTLDFSKGIKSIDIGAFENCPRLENVKFGKDFAFEAMTGEKKTYTLKGSPFGNCPMLSKFELDNTNGTNNNVKIENGAIYSQDGKTLVLVPYANETVAETLLKDVIKIAPYAFGANSKITTLDLSKIEELGEGALYGCAQLTTVTMPSTLKEIPAYTFYECTSLTTVEGQMTALTKIGDYAFYRTSMEKLSLPDSVNSIGFAAFAENTKLNAFLVPKNMTEIADATFANCSALASVIFQNSTLTKIGAQAFMASGIKNLNASGVTEIGNEAFAGCLSLNSVNLKAVKNIGIRAFYPASAGEDADAALSPTITSLNITTVENIGDYAFFGQSGIESLTLPNCKDIGVSAFEGCDAFTVNVRMPKCEVIRDRAFANTNLTDAILSYNLKFMAPTAFASTHVMAFSILNIAGGVAVNDNGTYFVKDGVLYKYVPNGYELVAYPCYKNDLVEYTVLDGTVKISAGAFETSEYLIQVNIPGSVESIGDRAFYDSSVTNYNFLGATAPNLETSFNLVTTTYNDSYAWQVYSNFRETFTMTLVGNSIYFNKYNPVRLQDPSDIILSFNNGLSLQNMSYTGGGFNNVVFGMVLMYPANASGFDTFIWQHYFDKIEHTRELCEDFTLSVMNLIDQLPAASSVTSANKAAIQAARSRYDSLKSFDQKLYVSEAGLYDKLVAAEKALATIDEAESSARNNVLNLINNLPTPSEITLDNKAAVEAARKAYNALTQGNKDLIDKAYTDKLTECENKIKSLENGNDKNNEGENSGCGTLTFGAGGGTGLLVGLLVVVALGAAVIFLRRRTKTTDK